ncbi:lysine transporter LysE [Labilibaculum antarcticum]|uniref:Lysine transporter LysE n=2 Tax=Labilibaculum antarcticum TaxID=1717717 RepID=A0A1Y1CE75_9BACT|nr:lysine transporter LysE [Labilibaculum antarcticum]
MVSIPLGPIGVLIIQKTIQKGRLAGFVSGMGAAVADMFYATVAAFGLGMVLSFIETQEFYLQLVGSVFLVYVGLRIFFTNPIKQIRGAKKTGKKGMLGDFVSIFFLTASNPIAVFVFVAVFAGTSIFGTNPTLRIELFLILGVLLGGGLWWYTLSTIINIFRKKFRLKQLFWINKISGIVIAVLGFLAFLACFEPIKSFLHS